MRWIPKSLVAPLRVQFTVRGTGRTLSHLNEGPFMTDPECLRGDIRTERCVLRRRPYLGGPADADAVRARFERSVAGREVVGG